MLAKRATERGITRVVFDRNGFLYHGRIKVSLMPPNGSGVFPCSDLGFLDEQGIEGSTIP